MNVFKKYILLVPAILSLFSCVQPVSPPPGISGRIVFPGDLAEISEDSDLLLSAQGSGSKIAWVSSLQGVLGTGGQISVRLIPGDHVITLESGLKELDSIRVKVREVSLNPGDHKSQKVVSGENNVLLPAGSYSPLFIGLSGNSPGTINLKPLSGASGRSRGFEPSGLMRDGNPRISPALLKRQKGAGSRSLDSVSKSPPSRVGDSRTFRVVDPVSGDQSAPVIIQADLLRQSGDVSLWVDGTQAISEQALEEFWTKVCQTAVPNTLGLYGDPPDINQDGTVAILMTPILNAGRKAIGFFNPSDFFLYSDDPGSDLYNPASNQGEILYTGIPAQDPADFAFSVDSLAATVAHELQHLIHFSWKTYSQWILGHPDPPVEELFLDEGMAHLTESLVGFGAAGGNLGFAARYLEHPGDFSLSEADADGSSDSVGKRGAMALFLSSLFEEAGGMGFEGTKMLDTGGITFLRNLQTCPATGWKALEAVTGIPTEQLVTRWLEGLNLGIPSDEPNSIHPGTGQIMSLTGYEGEVEIFPGRNVSLQGPARVDSSGVLSLLPYSGIFIQPIVLPTKSYWKCSVGLPPSRLEVRLEFLKRE